MRPVYPIIDDNGLIEKEELNILYKTLPGGLVKFAYGKHLIPIYANETFYQLTAYSKSEFKTEIQNCYDKLIMDEDIRKIAKEAEQAIRTGKEFSVLYKIERKDKIHIWCRMDGRFIYEKDDIYLYCMIIDVSESVKQQNKLIKEKEYLMQMKSLKKDVVFEYSITSDEIELSTESDKASVHRYFIDNYEDLMINHGKIYADDIKIFQQFCKELKCIKKYIQLEFRVQQENGAYHWMSVQGKRIFDQKGKPIRVLGTIENIHERKLKELKLIEQTKKDSLTQLYNKKTAKKLIEDYLAAGSRKSAVFAVIDLDNFKNINDRMGHLYGDQVLLTIAQAIQSEISDLDIASRFGGDEFIVFLKELDSLEQAEIRVERLCSRIREAFSKELSGKKITCSIGAAVTPDDGKVLSELFMKADKAMYYAKQQGRDCYKFFCKENETFFNQYEKNFYHPGNSLNEERLDLKKNIIWFAFELLEDMCDIRETLDTLISNVGVSFGLNRVLLVEDENEGDSLELRYDWHCNCEKIQKKNAGRFSREEWEDLNNQFDKNHIYVCPDVENFQGSERLKNILRELSVKSVLICRVKRKNQKYGYACFADCMTKRIWTKEEARNFQMLTRVMCSYIENDNAYKESEKRVKQLTWYDSLTGLLKYDKFREETEKFLKNGSGDKNYAFVCSDFNNFKYVNNAYGFKTGDEILKTFGDFVITNNKLAVMGCRDYADKFIALVEFEDEKKLAEQVCTYNRIFSDRQNQKYPGSNMGIYSGAYILNGSNNDIKVAIDNANIARKTLKAEKMPGFVIFNSEMEQKIKEELDFINSFKKAIEEEEFVLYLQPKVLLVNERLVGAEALVRWKRSNGNMVFPGEFIPLLEKNGSIVEFDFYMFEKIVSLLAKWKYQGIELISISVNLSRLHIFNRHLAKELGDIVRKHGIETKYIEIEITESAFIDNEDDLVERMEEIQREGFHISIDDFGAGYSSLRMLTEVPADIVKMDKDFLKNENGQERSQNVIKHVIKLAQDIDMQVLCEGVETEQQVSFLKTEGCNLAQGYFYAKPMPVEEFEELWLQK